ncbi:MAG: transcriptional regulator [bacterium]|nr:transcriptional regulator [bacterium]
MNKASINYRAGLMEDLRNPVEAAAYLNAALEDGSQEVFLVALRDVAEARGISDLSQPSSLNQENICRMLSEEDNSQLSSLSVLLENMGLKLAVEVNETVYSH